ncbi:hypothetical protein [Bifidobacterium callitrichidarum]|uniref:Uncharacterized protein n=1 Tax=Bifidobacterium callitrichidarum TaxID=2052941 RepID=A0A2U2N3Q0_9BIFI|nr:hypothetical protein [Bifidobacterium callitrichidarum]PWG63841.1 hypothetical protein DF196_10000 [Bifidobacterium callitrichidarum]
MKDLAVSNLPVKHVNVSDVSAQVLAAFRKYLDAVANYRRYLNELVYMQTYRIPPVIEYQGDGIPRTLSGEPFEPLEWKQGE